MQHLSAKTELQSSIFITPNYDGTRYPTFSDNYSVNYVIPIRWQKIESLKSGQNVSISEVLFIEIGKPYIYHYSGSN